MTSDTVLIDRALRALKGVIQLAGVRGVVPSDITMTIVNDLAQRIDHGQDPQMVLVPQSVLDLYQFMDLVFVSFTPQQDELMKQLNVARAHMKATKDINAPL